MRCLFVGVVLSLNSVLIYVMTNRIQRISFMAIFFSQHRNLVNKYGKSGSAKMPDSDALTPMEVRCLECWGVEGSGCK